MKFIYYILAAPPDVARADKELLFFINIFVKKCYSKSLLIIKVIEIRKSLKILYLFKKKLRPHELYPSYKVKTRRGKEPRELGNN